MKQARVPATVVLYAVDMGELEQWIDRRDARALEAARATLREDEETKWEPDELEVLDTLLARMVMEGKTYRDLGARDRYYLTQLLIDLFDEYVDSEAVSADWRLDEFETVLAALPRGGEARRLVEFLVRGRELQDDRALAPGDQDLEGFLPYFGFVRQAELPELVRALRAEPAGLRGRAAALRRELESACRTCLDSERDLLSFVM